jgi:hypothetical protein
VKQKQIKQIRNQNNSFESILELHDVAWNALERTPLKDPQIQPDLNLNEKFEFVFKHLKVKD